MNWTEIKSLIISRWTALVILQMSFCQIEKIFTKWNELLPNDLFSLCDLSICETVIISDSCCFHIVMHVLNSLEKSVFSTGVQFCQRWQTEHFYSFRRRYELEKMFILPFVWSSQYTDGREINMDGSSGRHWCRVQTPLWHWLDFVIEHRFLKCGIIMLKAKRLPGAEMTWNQIHSLQWLLVLASHYSSMLWCATAFITAT